jgi:hypothetical protein
MWLRIIAPIEGAQAGLWPPAAKAALYIMSMSACQPCRQRHSLRICHDMMFRNRLSSVCRIGAGFSPAPTARTLRLSTMARDNRCARHRAVRPIRPHAGAARRQRHANPAGGASRSCRSHSLSPVATSPRECQTSVQRQYRSMRLTLTREVSRLWVLAVQGVITEQLAPRVRRRQEVSPYLYCPP